MIRRLFYVGLGAALGVFVTRRVMRAAQAWTTPQGLAGQAAHLGESARDFADDVRAAMDERETQLRGALGVGEDGDEQPGRR